ncbi:MAG: hypothetical protein DHS20C01_23250 [marine bacterium B5-7]|nr:MAG: hypothetical protein DHS20C01_23250 [marine bacterium B5-7]
MKHGAMSFSSIVPVILLDSVSAHADNGNYGHMWNGATGMLWGPFGMIIWLGLLVVLIVILARWLGGRSSTTNDKHESDPLTIVKTRYARGEIDEDEYKRLRDNLKEE